MASFISSVTTFLSPSSKKKKSDASADEGGSQATKKYNKKKKGLSQDVPSSVLETSTEDPMSQLTQPDSDNDEDDEDDMPITQAETSSRRSGRSKKAAPKKVS